MPAVGAALRLGVLAVLVGVETGALFWWLRLVDEPAPDAGAAAGLATLFAGLFVAHALADVAVNGVNLDLPYGGLAAVSATETALWTGWLVLAAAVGGPVGVGYATGVLAVLLVPQHTLETNVLRGTSPRGDLVDLRTAGASLVVAAGAGAWLALIRHPGLVGGSVGGVDAWQAGVLALAAALLVGHWLGVRHATR